MPHRNIKLDRRFDWIGPTDPDSKIRRIKLRKIDGETEIERNYRLKREALNQWNSKFWAHHNQLFEKRKADFVNEYKKKHGAIAQLTPNEMSTFYTKFLNERGSALRKYNTDWYKQNARLIWPAVKVNMIRLKRLLLRK